MANEFYNLANINNEQQGQMIDPFAQYPMKKVRPMKPALMNLGQALAIGNQFTLPQTAALQSNVAKALAMSGDNGSGNPVERAITQSKLATASAQGLADINAQGLQAGMQAAQFNAGQRQQARGANMANEREIRQMYLNAALRGVGGGAGGVGTGSGGSGTGGTGTSVDEMMTGGDPYKMAELRRNQNMSKLFGLTGMPLSNPWINSMVNQGNQDYSLATNQMLRMT